MARRKITGASMQTLMGDAKTQEVGNAPKLTDDPNFPMFATPINEDILVYIPMTNYRAHDDETGEMEVARSLQHSMTIGKTFTNARCIHGLENEEAGYDGECPACKAMQEVWELYNRKMDAEAARLGIDRDNDPEDRLKSFRERILKEMDIKNADEYVAFPIVIIPRNKDEKDPRKKHLPASDALDNMKVVFVSWRQKRYITNILDTAAEIVDGNGSPAGLLFMWKFTYDSGGKPHTARDSAQNAKYTHVPKGNISADILDPILAKAEELAAPFTVEKAYDTILAYQFVFKEDLEADVDKAMKKTRTLLAASEASGTGVAGISAGATNVAITDGSKNPLEEYGTVAEPDSGDLGVGVGAGATTAGAETTTTGAGDGGSARLKM